MEKNDLNWVLKTAIPTKLIWKEGHLTMAVVQEKATEHRACFGGLVTDQAARVEWKIRLE